jgi:hypothetical protein
MGVGKRKTLLIVLSANGTTVHTVAMALPPRAASASSPPTIIYPFRSHPPFPFQVVVQAIVEFFSFFSLQATIVNGSRSLDLRRDIFDSISQPPVCDSCTLILLSSAASGTVLFMPQTLLIAITIIYHLSALLHIQADPI